MASILGRNHLSRMTRRILQQGSYSKPELCLYDGEGGPLVVKDCRGMHPFIKLFVGRRTQEREIRIYRCLRGVEGVPALKGVIDEDAFAVEYIQGETLARGLEPERMKKAIQGLAEVIQAIHDKRVVHLDLKQKRNVLVREDGTVAVIDFQSAFAFGNSLFGRFLFATLKRRDLAGLLKFKAKYTPDMLSETERKAFQREKLLSRLWPFNHLVRLLRKVFQGGGS